MTKVKDFPPENIKNKVACAGNMCFRVLAETEDFLGGICGKIERFIDQFSDRTLFGVLAIVYFLWRILTLPMFEFGGDAVWKWKLLRFFRETGSLFPALPEHHQGRWAQNIPVYWMMELFDTSDMWVASIIPIFSGFLLLVIIALIVRTIGSKTAAVAAVFSTMFYFVFFIESAQYLPSLPSTMYTLFALWLFLLYLKKPSRLWLPLIAGVMMGLAWGCKVTASYWCVGIALFLLFFPIESKALFRISKIRIGWDVILFSVGFLLIFIPETILINHFFHVPLGRISMLCGHHGNNPNLYAYNIFQYIFSPALIFLNFSGKMIYKFPFCLLFLLVLPPLFWALRNKNLSLQQKFLAFTLLVAVLIHSYLIVSVFPFKHPERPLPRYFLTLSCVSFILLYTIPGHLSCLKTKAMLLFKALYGVVWVVLIVMMVMGWVNDPLINGDHLLNKIRAYQCIRLHRSENLPFLVKYQSRRRYNSRTHKLVMLWKAELASTAELTELLTEKSDVLMKKWAQGEPVIDNRGNRYCLVHGIRPPVNHPVRCVVVDESQVTMQTITTIPEKESKKLK